MDQNERALLAETLRQRVTDEAGDQPLDGALADLGWVDALHEHPSAAVALLFTAQGAANATSSALGQVLGLALGGALPADAALVLPALGGAAPPGLRRVDGLRVRGLGPPTLMDADTVVVVTDEQAAGGAVRALMLDATALVLRPVHGLDPALGLVEVSADLGTSAAQSAAQGAAQGAHLGPGAWDRAVALGRLALGCELAGAGRTMLELACRHALERVQFGRPIASFQAVRHRLAESLVALEAAEALLAATEADASATTAAMAKALAGRAARTVAGHAQQVLAGIGFTTEHPLHRSVRRVLVLDQLLGSGDDLTGRLGAEILAHRALPPALPL